MESMKVSSNMERREHYRKLKSFPPKLKVKGNPKQMKIDILGVGGNMFRWICKKDEDGYWKINTLGYAYSNFQSDYRKDDIEWEMDDSNWDNVWMMINSGVCKVYNIKYR